MAKSTKCSWWLVVIGLPPYKNLPGSKIIIKRLFNEEGFKVKWGGWAIFMTAGHYGGAVSSPTPSPWKDAVSPWSPRMCTHWLVFCLLSLAEETLWQLLVRWKCDLRSHGLSSQWNSPGQNIGVGSRSLLQGIFPTQGSNPRLLHCRQILVCCLLLNEDQLLLGQESTVKRLHSSRFDWLWCSHCSVASTFWKVIFPQWWDSQVDTMSLTKSFSNDHLIIIECWEN